MKETTRRAYLWKHSFLGDLGFLMGVFDKKVWATNTSIGNIPCNEHLQTQTNEG